MLVSDPAQRYKVIRDEGIVGERIFPTIGLYVSRSDYPHHEGTYSHSHETVALLAKPLEQADALRVFRDHADELFEFDPAVPSEPLPA